MRHVEMTSEAGRVNVRWWATNREVERRKKKKIENGGLD